MRLKDKAFGLFQQYSSRDLAGLRIEHGAREFEDGSSVIVTLKDSGMYELVSFLKDFR